MYFLRQIIADTKVTPESISGLPEKHYIFRKFGAKFRNGRGSTLDHRSGTAGTGTALSGAPVLA